MSGFAIDFRNPNYKGGNPAIAADDAGMRNLIKEYYQLNGGTLPVSEPPLVYDLTNPQTAVVGVVLTPYTP